MSRGEGMFTALHLAVLARYLPVRVQRSGAREVEPPSDKHLGIIEIGPDEPDDEIATIACRAFVRRRGRFDEARVRKVVEHHGFSYVPPGRDVHAAAE